MARTARGESWIPPSLFGRPSAAERAQADEKLERELEASARTISEHVKAEPDSLKGQLLADLLVGLLGERVDDEVAAAAKRLPRVPPDAPECATLFGLGAGLWRHLLERGVMTQSRGAAIARRIAPCCDEPALLLLFQREAESHAMTEAALAFATALDTRFPKFRRSAGRLRITRELLARIGADEGVRGLELRFHPDGHLARASVPGKAGPTLTLDALPGAGRFQHTGKRGGYGFHTDERYERGAVHTTFFSPWHDGDESETPTDWVCWVLQCTSSVLSEARRGAPARARKKAREAR